VNKKKINLPILSCYMSKRRSIISYDKLSLDQKKQILRDFPDGYINHLTTIKTPNGETLDAFVWETEEVIYLVKINKSFPKVKQVVEEEEEEFEDDFEKMPMVKDDDMEDEDGDEDEDEDEDEYDQPYEEDEEEDEDE